jgi:sarcosine oxidase subunit beta
VIAEPDLLADAATPPPTPLPERAELVIIGGGVMGLAIAYGLCQLGCTDIVILERSYLAAGASGRNGGGVRQQWSTELNVRLMQESVELCRRFAKELGVNVWFRQGGYLFLARTGAEIARLERNLALQNRCGVPTRMISPDQVREIVPELDTGAVVGAAYNPTDGILFPWPFLWGYARRATEMGARLYTFTGVTGIDVDRKTSGPGRFTVHTTRGVVRAARVLNAAGAWSAQVARMVGIELPTHPVRHEICSSEPLKPFLRPMVSALSTGLYFSQSMRGEIVGGVSLTGDEPTLHMGSRLKFLATYARELCGLMPVLGDIKVLRQWAGPYDMTADGYPILGEPAELPGFHLCCGFGGHGFMMAPVMGVYYARALADGERHEIFDRCQLARFAGDIASEREDFVIG